MTDFKDEPRAYYEFHECRYCGKQYNEGFCEYCEAYLDQYGFCYSIVGDSLEDDEKGIRY